MLKSLCCFVCIMVLVTVLSVVSSAAAVKDTLVIGLQDDVASLDPAKTYETAAAGIISLTYETLVDFDRDDLSKTIPKVAESWKVGEDGKTWTFYIRKGITFASGNPVNSEAVVFSLQRSLKLGNWILPQFGVSEKSITALDDYRVQIVLDQQYAPGLFLACFVHISTRIIDPMVMQYEQKGDMGSAWLEEHSAGSGAYILESRKREAPTEYTLNANNDYWGTKPKFRKIVIKGIQESVEQMLMLEQGEIDIAWNLQPDQTMMLSSNPDIRISETLLFYITWIVMNQGYPPLTVPEVRDAVRYAIDYDGIVGNILQGAGEKIQTFIPKGLSGYNPAMPYNRDLERAKQLLATGGYPDGFAVELKCLDYSPWLDIAQKVKADLAQIGIQVTIHSMNGDRLIKANMSRESQMLLWEWGPDYADPDSYARPFAHSDSPDDDASVKLLAWWNRYVNKETSTLIEQAAQEFDSQKRVQLYHQITEIILDDGPYAILYSPIKQYGMRSELTGLIIPPTSMLFPFPPVK